ncbi:MAG TPA: beta-glucosidase BglX [Arachidicoccus sp.]|nr:beta-glucosidase BglX [Arachidicoccus sp.]
MSKKNLNPGLRTIQPLCSPLSLTAFRPLKLTFTYRYNRHITYILAALLLCLCIVKSGRSQSTGAQPAHLTAQQFIDQLLQKMTLEEKIGQLNLSVMSGGAVTGTTMSADIVTHIKSGRMGGIFGIWDPAEIRKIQQLAVDSSRLHIPLLFGLDVIHGHKTIFPVPLALASSWDTALIRKAARVAGIEASADGINWVYSPMVDIARDPRWGRVVEGAGEDPFLGSQIAAAMVKGYQGDDLSLSNTVMACVKHFALYGAGVAGREYNSVDMSRLQMYQYYLPPYKAAVDAGAGSFMTSFNDINGMPATANHWLLTDLLRGEWGFKGFITSDYGSVSELANHGLGTPAQVAALALKAGTDMEMVGDLYINTLKQSLESHKITLAEINSSCRRILEAKYRLGLFKDPYHYLDLKRSKKLEMTPEHLELAKEAATNSFVLLKNDGILPLKPTGKIAVIGPLADSKENMVGAWNIAGDPQQCVTIVEGIKNFVAGDGTVTFQKGANITDDSLLRKRVNTFKKEITTDPRSAEEMIRDAVKSAENADVIIAVVGEAADMTGESASRTEINIPSSQQRLLKALRKTGKPMVMVLMNGRPLTLNWADKHANALLDVWFPGTTAGPAVADVLFGQVNPSGKLTMSFPRSVGQVPIYYNHKSTGRPFDEQKDGSKFKSDYLDQSNLPLYPFGYGLSYTKFSYGPIKVSDQHPKGNQTITATVKVTNTGKYRGKETLQCYLTDPVARVTRSVQDLIGFKKISLAPGESREVPFEISTRSLSYYDEDLHFGWDPGAFIIRIGTNSRDTESIKIDWEK